MNILNQLNWRYAVRRFNETKISGHQIEELAEATRLTASSYGLQPYKLLVIESDEVRDALLAYSMGQIKVKESSHLFVLACNSSIDDNFIDHYFARMASERSIHESSLMDFKQHVKDAILGMTVEQRDHWADQQAYIALGNLLTVAALKEIDACPMGGFDNKGFDQVLGLKELGLRSCVICTLGYRSVDDESANDKKVRQVQEQFLIQV